MPGTTAPSRIAAGGSVSRSANPTERCRTASSGRAPRAEPASQRRAGRHARGRSWSGSVHASAQPGTYTLLLHRARAGDERHDHGHRAGRDGPPTAHRGNGADRDPTTAPAPAIAPGAGAAGPRPGSEPARRSPVTRAALSAVACAAAGRRGARLGGGLARPAPAAACEVRPAEREGRARARRPRSPACWWGGSLRSSPAGGHPCRFRRRARRARAQARAAQRHGHLALSVDDRARTRRAARRSPSGGP